MSDERRLTTREREYIMLVVDGLSNKDIAERLHVAEQTVKNTLLNASNKLQIYGRVSLAVHAVRSGWDKLAAATPTT